MSINAFNPMKLEGRHILITGASSGIGRACAIVSSRLGAFVVLVSRDANQLHETHKQLTGTGHKIVPFDLMQIRKYDELFARCTDDCKLDGLVHAAGMGPAIPLQAISSDAMTSVMTLNFFAFLELVKWFAKKKVSTGGSVVGISSVSGSAGWQGFSLYGASKAAMDSAVRSLAVELAPKNIRVNSVVPSNIQTKMLDAVLEVGGDDALNTIKAKQPLGIGMPDDVACAAAFLLSDAAKFITGTHLVVDGGYLAQ